MIEPGALLDGRYRLEEQIGAGGAGEVWRARHVTLNSIVAIKVLRVGASHRELARKRFLQEARFTAQLRIRQAVQVHDFGFIDERPYLVMELLKGETLKERIANRGRLSVRETTTVLRQAARALERAHALGIIHRDFKPDNVFILRDEDGEDEVRVVDFGIAKLVGGFDEDEPPPSDLEAQSDRGILTSFTRTGGLLGTPYYMAPEQVQSTRTLGPEVDIWALGVVAYECLIGKRPFDGENAGLLFKAILEGEHVPAETLAPELPKAFSTWFRTACAPDPARRFADVRNAVATLEEALGVLPIVGPSWLEATDPSMALRQVHRASSPGDEPREEPLKASSSLSGTASSTETQKRPRRRAAMAIALLLVVLAVGAGVVAGRRGADRSTSSAAATSAPGSAIHAEPTVDDAEPTMSTAMGAASVASAPAAASHDAVEESDGTPPDRTVPRPAAKPPRTSATKNSTPRAEAEPVPPRPADTPASTATATATATKAKPPSALELPPLGI